MKKKESVCERKIKGERGNEREGEVELIESFKREKSGDTKG